MGLLQISKFWFISPLPPQVNLVNADLLAKKRGLRIVETVVPSDGTGVLDEIEARPSLA